MATSQTTTVPPRNLFGAPSSTSIPTSKPTLIPPRRVRQYKDFLTPALHRRFSYAAALALAVCYIESIFISPPGLLWFWNPLSFTGIRTLLLFLPCLAVFIVRVANLHFGEITSPSRASTITSSLFSWKGLHTFGWYLASAFFFGEVFIWSKGTDAHLGWVDSGRAEEWSYLNENPIWLRAVWFCLAFAQAVIHLLKDYDELLIPLGRDNGNQTQRQQQASTAVPRSLGELQAILPVILGRTGRLAVVGTAFTLPVYFLLLRTLMWPYFYQMGHIFYSGVAKQSRPTGFRHVGGLLWQSLSSAGLLILLWELSNAIFTIYVTRPPVDKTESEPLTGLIATQEKSKDPNESLIHGLKSKKDLTKAFAFWELSLICSQFDIRRRTIYTEVDRAGGSTWAVISQVCMNEITAIQERMKATQQPAQPPSSATQAQQATAQPVPSYDMPRIADRSVQNGDVWTKPNPSFRNSASNVARSAGQNHGVTSPLVPGARRAIEWSADHMVSKDTQARFTPGGMQKEASGLLNTFLQSWLGEPFRQTFANKTKSIILGSPVSAKVNIIHASRGLSNLCSCSLKEDDYGQVSKSVAQIIRTYAETIRGIQAFVQTATPDWTDVYFNDRARYVPEIEEVVGELRRGLEKVVLTFGEYAESVNVSKKELREARELIGRGQEMRSV